jgi:hypothetical protein
VDLDLLLDLLLLKSLYAFLSFIGGVFFYQRWRWRRRKRLGESSYGFYPRTTSLGNALHQLQVLAEPRIAYVAEEKLDEEADEADEDDEDDESGPDDPLRHLHRQAARIRRGERLDRLTVLLRRSDGLGR